VIRIEKVWTWKVISSTRRTRICYPHIRVMPLNTRTCNRPPLAICLTNVRNRENFPGWDPPSSVTCSTALRHTRPCLSSCLACVIIVCFIFIVSSPSSLDRPPRPPSPTLLCTATSSTTSSFQQSFQASIPPSFDHPDIAYILSTACIRVE
jgi:hypothetical protein